MKKLGNGGKIGVFELLDREKEWEWGEGNIGFDAQVENYLAAVTELGRRLTWRDQHGKWEASYNWSVIAKYRFNTGDYSKERRDRLTTLPYLLSDHKAEKQQRMVQLVVDFKLKHGRTPLRNNRNECSIYHTYSCLGKAHRKGSLSSEILTTLEVNGIFLNTSRATSRRLTKIELFVTQHKRRPLYTRPLTAESRLYQSLWYLHQQVSKGLLSPEDSSRLQALERKIKEYDKQNKRVRLAG